MNIKRDASKYTSNFSKDKSHKIIRQSTGNNGGYILRR